MSLSRPPERARASPSHIDVSQVADSAATSGATSPTGTEMAASPCQPSTMAPKSIEIRSPGASFSAADGMPCTTRSLTEAQMTAG